MKNIKYWLKLLTTPGIGKKKARRLVKFLGDPEQFIINKSDLINDLEFISTSVKNELYSSSFNFDWDKISQLMTEYQIKVITFTDERYPSLLKNIYDPPLILFYRGNWNENYFKRCLAIVGTRKPTTYGKLITKKIGSEIARSGFTIVSGLAHGIDTLAHFSAVENGLPTLAILGTGCDQIYPGRNRELAEKIIRNGLLISEYMPGSKPERWNFPNRNRIISGISLGTFVVEGSKKSGALLTAKFALDQNREVFALPGDINKNEAKGPNYLLKLGAKIVTSSEDILDEFNLSMKDNVPIYPEFTEKEKQIYDIIARNRPDIHYDELFLQSKLSLGELSVIILNLELKSAIEKLPGNKLTALY